LTAATYTAVANHFRGLWGKEAGWAHSVLFTADLKSFAGQLAAKVEVKSEETVVKTEQGEETIMKKEEMEQIGIKKEPGAEDLIEEKKIVVKKSTKKEKKRAANEIQTIKVEDEIVRRRSKRARTSKVEYRDVSP
jgi:N-glycosylase/DNA lyase